jgi:hypothetical protein
MTIASLPSVRWMGIMASLMTLPACSSPMSAIAQLTGGLVSALNSRFADKGRQLRRDRAGFPYTDPGPNRSHMPLPRGLLAQTADAHCSNRRGASQTARLSRAADGVACGITAGKIIFRGDERPAERHT